MNKSVISSIVAISVLLGNFTAQFFIIFLSLFYLYFGYLAQLSSVFALNCVVGTGYSNEGSNVIAFSSDTVQSQSCGGTNEIGCLVIKKNMIIFIINFIFLILPYLSIKERNILVFGQQPTYQVQLCNLISSTRWLCARSNST